MIGYIETETLQAEERLSRHGGWADIGNLHITKKHRRRGVATWLLGQAADRLRLAQTERLLTYAWLEGQDPTGQDYTTTGRSWQHPASANSPAPSEDGPGPPEPLMIDAPSWAHGGAFRLGNGAWPESAGHCLGICLPGSMNGFGTVMPRWRPVGVSTSNSWPSGSASPAGSIA